MIVRKMRNNVVKKIPKDFGSAIVGLAYEETTDETYFRVRKEIVENANSEVIDIDSDDSEQPDPEPQNVPNEQSQPEPEAPVYNDEPAPKKETASTGGLAF